MDNQLKVALVGFGKMGRHHFAVINAAENAAVVAVVDPNIDALSSQGEALGDTKTYQDVGEMLSHVKPDVVHIVTPPETHFELAKMSIEAGAHVYVEKPFALKVTDAVEILDLAEQHDRRVCPAHQLLFQRSGIKYKEKLDLIGQVLLAESYFSFRPVRRSATGSGSVDPIDQLIDILPHPVYLLLDALCAGGKGEKTEIQSIEATAFGDVYAIIRRGERIGALAVTVRGRPVESFLKIVGTNGSVNADYILSGVTTLPGPGASAVSQITMPFSQSRQRIFGTLASLFRILTKRQGSYDGLRELIEEFYSSLLNDSEPPISSESLLDTVKICEQISGRLFAAQREEEKKASRALATAEKNVPRLDPEKETLLVTGGTGFLGKKFVRLARSCGYPVRVISRQIPRSGERIPGIDYVQADLAEPLASDLFDNVGLVIHLAAETEGGQEAHVRNSVQATTNLVKGCVNHRVARLINISSIAVMQSSRQVGRSLDEAAPIDSDNIGRGPYVWGKAKAEELVVDASKSGALSGKTIRLGPLVDFQEYVPPGRLGRELGNFFVAMGNPWNKVPICSVDTAAKVILYYASSFEDAPVLLNLVEPDAPKRSELWRRYKNKRPELTAIWVLKPILIAMSATLKLVLRLIKPGQKPIDVYAAFSSEDYDTSLAKEVILEAEQRDAT